MIQEMLKRHRNYKISGLDTGYFAHCLTGAEFLPEIRADQQIYCDIRDVSESHLAGVDSVIHLAAISNDPMGNSFENATEAINGKASVELAKKAKNSGVRSFIFASSCSMYGSAGATARTEEDNLNPLTAYARSKVYTEQALRELASEDFVVSSLRFSTACGMSDRLRLDLVLNDFVASAVTTGRIVVLSDGSPWRPLIHVKDMARSIDWAVSRPVYPGCSFLAVNVGSDHWNYQIRDLATACADVIGGVEVSINKNAEPDKRSYRVNFNRFRELAPDHQPKVSLEDAIKELHQGLTAMEFNRSDFRETWYMRLKVLSEHIDNKRLDRNLRWLLER